MITSVMLNQIKIDNQIKKKNILFIKYLSDQFEDYYLYSIFQLIFIHSYQQLKVIRQTILRHQTAGINFKLLFILNDKYLNQIIFYDRQHSHRSATRRRFQVGAYYCVNVSPQKLK